MMPTTWTDPFPQPGRPLRAVHLNELRAAVVAAGGTPPSGWTDGATVGVTTPIRAQHVVELRTGIQTVWSACGLGPLPSWSSGVSPGGPSVGSASTPIRATDIRDLRSWLNQSEAVLPLSLNLPGTLPSVGGTFDVPVILAAGDQLIDAVQFNLDFDPTKLAVVDQEPNSTGLQLLAGPTFSDVLQNTVDNQTGHIAFAAGDLGGGAHSGTLTLATIRFQVLAVGTSLVSFVNVFGRPSQAVQNAAAIPLCLLGAEILIT
jgi:hypothetical protein